MEYYVIYSFDCKRNHSVNQFKPPQCRKLWQLTEGDDQYEYDYLGENYEHGKHRKYCATLNKIQFRDFIDDCNLYLEDVETMGSLTEYGHLPALSFHSDDTYAINQGAYVTPLPEHVIKGKHLMDTMDDRNWNRIKQILLRLYGMNQNYHNQTYKNHHLNQ